MSQGHPDCRGAQEGEFFSEVRFHTEQNYYRRKNKGNACSVKKYIRNIQFLDFCFLVGEVRSECNWTVMTEKSLKPIAQLGEAADQSTRALNFQMVRN